VSAADEVGVAVVGLGVGEQHARSFAGLPDCHLRWLYDLDPNKAEQLACALGADAVATGYEQILEDPHVDVVSIASYDDAHAVQVIAALKAGKHVFAEKPLCTDLKELAEIKAAWMAHDGRVKLSSNHILRAAPVYIDLKRRIERGDFGEVYAFDGDYLYGRLAKITDGWRAKIDDYSVMLGGGVHLVDLMVWLTGQRPAKVFAVGNRACTSGTPFRYDDFTAATMTFPSGMVGRISAHFGCVHKHQHVVRIFGTEATLVLDDAGPRLSTSRAEAPQPMGIESLPSNKGDLIPSFINTIRVDGDMRQHTQELFDVISICAACDDSVKAGREVEVQYV
jgi:predicted dehydrogenase